MTFDTCASRAVRALSAVGVLAAGACAHAPPREGAGPVAGGAAVERSERVLVTGSHVPRPVGASGLPVAEFPVRVYGRAELHRGGVTVWHALVNLEPGAR